VKPLGSQSLLYTYRNELVFRLFFSYLKKAKHHGYNKTKQLTKKIISNRMYIIMLRQVKEESNNETGRSE